MPPSALAKLSQLNISYPMMFKISDERESRFTHCGVLEFISEEGKVYLPEWLMGQIGVQDGQLVKIDSTNLPLGKFIKIEPQSVDFLDINDPKAVLEHALRSFSALTLGDVISILYNEKLYKLKVLEAKPEADGISIVETDLQVDFAPPVGYEEPKYERQEKSIASSLKNSFAESPRSFSAFQGQGQNLKGRVLSGETFNSNIETPPAALNLPPGKIFFAKPIPKEESSESSSVFSGEGRSLK